MDPALADNTPEGPVGRSLAAVDIHHRTVVDRDKVMAVGLESLDLDMAIRTADVGMRRSSRRTGSFVEEEHRPAVEWLDRRLGAPGRRRQGEPPKVHRIWLTLWKLLFFVFVGCGLYSYFRSQGFRALQRRFARPR